MVRWFLVTLVAVAACSSPPRARPAPPAPAAPITTLARIEASPDLDGKLVGASPARATVVVVMASWCGHCRVQLAELDRVRQAHPTARFLGINYKGHEEYDGRGSSAIVRAYVAEHAAWLRVVPADEALFTALGRPPMVPTVYVFDAAGTLVAAFDRRERSTPDAAELRALLAGLGA